MTYHKMTCHSVLASVFFGAAFSWSVRALADTCPLSGTSVEASVQSSVSWDAQTKLYTYNYTVQNLKSSPLNLKRFLVIGTSAPQNSKSPNNWDVDFYPDSNGRIDWSTYLPDPKAKETGGLPPVFYAIKPSQSLSGFSFQSPNPPGQTKYMVAGDTAVPTVTGTADDDEPTPTCPGWDFEGPKYETMNTGITQGPSDPNVQSVVIRMRGEDEGRKAVPIDPLHAKGRIGLLIPSTKSFDASTIDPASIQFGPAKVAPLSNRLVPSRKEDLEEELEEWENVAFGRCYFDRHEEAKERVKRKSLFLVFDLASLGVRCVLDHALFLTGKTKDGKAISGGVSIRLVGCDPRKPGKKEYLKKHHASYLPPVSRTPAEIAEQLARNAVEIRKEREKWEIFRGVEQIQRHEEQLAKERR